MMRTCHDYDRQFQLIVKGYDQGMIVYKDQRFWLSLTNDNHAWPSRESWGDWGEIVLTGLSTKTGRATWRGLFSVDEGEMRFQMNHDIFRQLSALMERMKAAEDKIISSFAQDRDLINSSIKMESLEDKLATFEKMLEEMYLRVTKVETDHQQKEPERAQPQVLSQEQKEPLLDDWDIDKLLEKNFPEEQQESFLPEPKGEEDAKKID